MNLLESINLYADSILKLWIGYAVSIALFSLYSRTIRQHKSMGKECSLIYKLICRVLVLLPVALTVGLRDIDVGADTYNFWMGYLNFSNLSFTQALTLDNTGVCFNIIRWIVCRLTHGNVFCFFTLIAIFTIYFVLIAIEKWNLKYPGIALFVFYCCNGPNLMNQIRQLLAVAILLYAYWYAYNQNWKKYFFWSIVAGLFHLSALLTSVVIYVIQPRKKRSKKNIIMILILFGSIFAMEKLLTMVGEFLSGSKYEMYFTEIGQIDIGLGLILTLIPTVIPVALFSKYLDSENRIRNTIVMNLPARLAGYYSYFIYRLCHYFGSVNVIALPMIIERYSSKYKLVLKFFLCIVCVIYFFAYFVWANGSIYFPYKTSL